MNRPKVGDAVGKWRKLLERITDFRAEKADTFRANTS